MAWTPRIHVVDYTTLVDNLLDFIKSNHEDALEWAGGSGLDDYQKFYTNATGRLQTIFPSLMVLTQDGDGSVPGEVLDGNWTVTLEGTVSGSDPDELVRNIRFYWKALESMIVNIESETLTTGCSPPMHIHVDEEPKTKVDIARLHTSGFLQIFQTQIKYKLKGSLY